MAEARAEIVANVWKLVASVGDEVGAGDVLAVLETMKMEIPVNAGVSGTVTEIRVVEGQIVQEGDVIAVVE
jgi:biotin carboxyl carrier protein